MNTALYDKKSPISIYELQNDKLDLRLFFVLFKRNKAYTQIRYAGWFIIFFASFLVFANMNIRPSFLLNMWKEKL